MGVKQNQSSFCERMLSDPKFFKENRLDAHSDHIWYASEQEEKSKKSSYFYSMDGLWKFQYAKNPNEAPKDFFAVEYDCKSWDDIRVPAHIQMEGYDVPHYVNTQYPWDGKEEILPGEAPRRFNPTASYVKYFVLPKKMQKALMEEQKTDTDDCGKEKEEQEGDTGTKGVRICISFQGVESAFALWLNGQYIGFSENSFDPAEFDLTDYLIPDGENKLAVRVFKWCSGSWCEDQDFFRFSGIFRSVYLYEKPVVHLEDLSAVPVLSQDFKEGMLELSMKLLGKGKAGLHLLRNGELVATSQMEFCNETVQTALRVSHPDLWSAEIPSLYELQISLEDENGKVSEFILQHIGFRRFELDHGIMKLNGKRIVFKGVNRHEFSSLRGRVPNQDEVFMDVVTMKQNNINAIRTSHYPDASYLYDLCDQYGLYLIAENNMESHGTWDAALSGKQSEEYIVPNDHEEWEGMMLDRANSCYERDKNHPSILIWSCGNESWGGRVIHEMAELFRKKDPHRLVHYEGIFHDRRYNDTSDIESQMYTPAAEIRKFIQKHPDKPFICCEYTHAMGNSNGAMHKYTDLTDTEPKYQGGFIWDYIDQSIEQKDRYGRPYMAYGGDFGDRPNDGNFCTNGIMFGDRTLSPKVQEVKYNYQNISILFEEGKEEGTFTIQNKNLFLNTSVFDARVILQEDGEEILNLPASFNVEPLSEKKISLPNEIKEILKEKGIIGEQNEEVLHKEELNQQEQIPEYTVTISFRLKQDEAWAKAGHEVAFGQNIYKSGTNKEYSCGIMLHSNGCRRVQERNGNERTVLAETRSEPEFYYVKGNNNLGVYGDSWSALFSLTRGVMTSYVYGGKEMLKTNPKLNFWRAPTDNDRGNFMPQRYAQWKIASLYAVPSSSSGFSADPPRIEVKKNSIALTYCYDLSTRPSASCYVTYEVFGDGTVKTLLHYDVVKELGDMPEFGMLFQLDADYDRVTWYGLGPGETYADRMHGAKLGIYVKSVEDCFAPYVIPQESGNHCGVRWAKVTDRLGRGMIFLGDSLSFSVLPWSPHEIENARHGNELPPILYTYVCVASHQMGVGGDNSWGALTHPEYLLDVSGKAIEFTFSFRGC